MESSNPDISAGNTGLDSGSTKTSTKRIKGSEEDGFSCDRCDFTSIYSSNLSQHIKSKHEGVRYPCDQCEYVATEKGHLNTHKKSIHEGIKYLCDRCDYAATTSSNLKRHKHTIITYYTRGNKVSL